MSLIPATTHGIVDYAAGVALLLAPWVLGLPPGAATLVLQVIGVATVASSLVTDYTFSIAKLLPYRLHLMLDMAMGLAMLITAGLTLQGGLGEVLLIGAGLIYIVVPALSWPRRLS